MPGAGTADVSQAPTGNVAHLAAVRLVGKDGFDRLVLEFADRVPGYTVGYRPLPAHADASGAEIALPGASALLQLTLNPATPRIEPRRSQHHERLRGHAVLIDRGPKTRLNPISSRHRRYAMSPN